jgi:hypothetical protein
MCTEDLGFYTRRMANQAKWVLSCKNCHAECRFAEIPSEGVANWFFPKKPQVPANFTHKCENCGYANTYERTDLTYRDETMPSRAPSTNCGASTEARDSDRAFGAAK